MEVKRPLNAWFLSQKKGTYQQLLEYLRGSRIGSPVYPPEYNTNDKRGLHQQAVTFEEGWDTLPLVKGSQRKTLRRVIVDPAEKTRLIRAVMMASTEVTSGRDKTLSNVYTTVVDFSCPGS